MRPAEEHFCDERLLPGECIRCVGGPRPRVAIDSFAGRFVVEVEVLGRTAKRTRIRFLGDCPKGKLGDVAMVAHAVVRPPAADVPLVAALYVDPRGAYSGIVGVDLWGLPVRDAREYAGSSPVVAHPPCKRWGKYWSGGPSHPGAYRLGDDGGCFASALAAVRRCRGVLEHPAHSHAWRAHGLAHPPRDGGWVPADDQGGWTCHVEQGHYGHVARKGTWLYAVGVELPELAWGPSAGRVRLDDGFHSTAERVEAKRNGHVSVKVERKWRERTPDAFRDVLIAMARSAAPGSMAASP